MYLGTDQCFFKWASLWFEFLIKNYCTVRNHFDKCNFLSAIRNRSRTSSCKLTLCHWNSKSESVSIRHMCYLDYLSCHCWDFILIFNLTVVGSAGELSDGGFSDSSYSRLRVLNRQPPRSQGGRNHQRNGSVDSSKGSYLSSPDIVRLNALLLLDLC